jgi:hypothetical protein
MKTQLPAFFVLACFIAATPMTAPAAAQDRQDDRMCCKERASVPNKIPNKRLRLIVVGDKVIARPGGSTAIACCTTWNSSEGTTGCASFEGNTCPDYAPFEAYD